MKLDLKTKNTLKLGRFVGVPLIFLATLLIGIALACGAPISPLWLLAPVLTPVALVVAICACAVIIGLLAISATLIVAALVIVFGIAFLIPVVLGVVLYKINEIIFGF